MLAVWAPWIAIVVAIAAIFSGQKRSADSESTGSLGKSAHVAGGVCLLIGLLLLGAGMMYRETLPGIQQAGIGALIGTILAALAGFLGSRLDPSNENHAAPVAIGIAAMAVTWLFPEAARTSLQFGVVFGLAAGSWILGIAPTHWPSIAATVAGVTGTVGWLGGFGYGDRAPFAGILIGLAAVLLSVVSQFAIPKKEGKPDLAILVVAVLTIGLSWLIATKLLFLDDIWKLVALGAAGAVVVHWMVPKSDENRSLPIAMSLIMWLAIATIAFAMRRGFGMSICLASATFVLTLAGNWKALLTLGPLAALCMYRLMKEMHPDAAKALDIGQHYGLMGLLIGASILVLAVEWKQSTEGRKDVGIAVASSGWVVLFAMLPAVAAIVIAAKGFVGVVAGVGIGTAIVALKSDSRPHVFALQTGVSAALAMEYAWLTQKLDLTRDDKVKSLIGFAIAIGILALLIVWLSKPRNQSSNS